MKYNTVITPIGPEHRAGLTRIGQNTGVEVGLCSPDLLTTAGYTAQTDKLQTEKKHLYH